MRTNMKGDRNKQRIHSPTNISQRSRYTTLGISIFSERPRVQVPSTPIATVRNFEGGVRNGAGHFNYRTLHVLSLESEIVYMAAYYPSPSALGDI